MKIEELRNKIDALDKEIVKLLLERMSVSADVAAYKFSSSLPILDQSREDALLKKIADLSGDMNGYVHEIYLEILKQSRNYQKEIINKSEKNHERI